MAASKHTDASFEDLPGASKVTVSLGPIPRPPGLEDPLEFGPAPGLEFCCTGPLPGQFPPHASVATAQQDPLWSVYQEYLQQRSECLHYEQRSMAEEHARLKAKLTCPGPGLLLLGPPLEGSGSNSTVPLKPPGIFTPIGSGLNSIRSKATAVLKCKPHGIFERAGSSHSLASTAATATVEAEECMHEENNAVGLQNPLHSTAVAAEKKAVEEVIRELRVEHLCDGHVKVYWPVDARKLCGKDKQIISPSFEILSGHSFKLMVKPKSIGLKKGQANFHKARGSGSVELKLLDGVASAPVLRFRISVGGSLPRGPVEHDFSINTVGGLATNDNTFGFASTVDPNSCTCLVILEVLPESSPLEEK